MVALFGFVWAVVTTAACVLAVASRRSVLAWMKARRWRKSGDDTVEIVRPGLRKVAVYAALVMLALPAGVMAGSTAMPGPSAQGSVGLPLTGGTVTGQIVSSGVTCDVSTGAGEKWSVCPSTSGYFELAKASESATAEIMSRWTLSDVTTTKFFFSLENSTSSNSTFAPTMYGLTNSTTATHAGLNIFGVVPDTADVATNSGAVITGAAESTDGYTGTWSALENRPIHSFRNYDTDKLHVGPQGQLRQPGYLTALPTCDSTTVATQTFYNKAAANKISHCVCVMTAAATYAWETSHASGDCT